MKTSNITKSALALALGLCASGAWAATVTPVSEDFEGAAFDNGINGVTTNNLTWADTEGYSAVSGGKLVVDAADTPTSATIDPSVTNGINSAFGARNAKFNATVTFVPATEDPVVTGADLKFALYAKAVTGATNLYVIANGGAQPTGISLANVVDQNVEVAFTAADTFTVKVGASTSSAFTFANSGDISKVEFSGNGEVEQLGFSYDLVDTTITWPTTLSVVSYTVDGVAGDALTASAGTKTISTEPGAAIVITGTTPYGATVTASGTAGTGFGVTTTTTDLDWYFPCTATAGQNGTAANPYEIDSVNALVALKDAVANVAAARSLCYVQTANIDMSSAGTFAGIGGDFTGTYDGGNKTISNIQFSAATYRGLFNKTTGATIKNLTIDTVTFVASSGVEFGGAAFVGKVYGNTVLSNLTAKGSVGSASAPCNHNVAGIAVRTYAAAKFFECVNEAAVYGEVRKIGGIVAISQDAGTIEFTDCANSGSIVTTTITHHDLGDDKDMTTGSDGLAGIIGYANRPITLKNCVNTGAIQTAAGNTGAVVGQLVGKVGTSGSISDLGGNQAPADKKMVGSGTGFTYATAANSVATTVTNIVVGGSYLLEGNAAPTIELAAGDTIAFDTALGYTIDAAGITKAAGLKEVAVSTSGTVTTYTGVAYATVTVSVSGGAHATANWTIDGTANQSAPATLTEGQTYSVTYTADSDYGFDGKATYTVAETTVGTENITIVIPDATALPSYAEGNTGVVEGHTLSADEASYLNDLVGTKGATAVENALNSIDEEDFVAAALLNQDITEANAGSYEFNVTKIKKSGGTVKVTVKLTRSGTLIGGINGTLVLQTCATPTGTYADAQTLVIDGTAFAGTAAEATAEFTFTGVTGDSNKFFKAVIR